MVRQPVSLTAAQRQTVTPFQVRVYEALLQVQKGRVTTYKELGAVIDCKSSQAIGQALKRNPFAPAVPCHRVVSTNY
jgi:methylated-DNA-[protein]-cysteine S-methyltransferase